MGGEGGGGEEGGGRREEGGGRREVEGGEKGECARETMKEKEIAIDR